MVRRQLPPPLPPGLDVFRPEQVLGTRVLVVDDEPTMRMQLKIDLDDLGYMPVVAGSVEEARSALVRERPAAVLLDLVLDERDSSGFELLTWIRGRQPALPVIVLSAAQVNSAAIRRAYECGASSYFVKGNVPMAHIYSDLAARLVERAAGRSGSYAFGRIEFNATRRVLTCDGRTTSLTPQQTQLLVFLAQASRPVAAGELIEAGLFRPDAARSTVHSALLALRRRLDGIEANLGSRFLVSSSRGYSLGAVG